MISFEHVCSVIYLLDRLIDDINFQAIVLSFIYWSLFNVAHWNMCFLYALCVISFQKQVLVIKQDCKLCDSFEVTDYNNLTYL